MSAAIGAPVVRKDTPFGTSQHVYFQEYCLVVIDENGYEDPLDVRIVTDETNLLIFEQEVNRYNQNPYCTMPNVYYEQLPFEECEKFQGFLLTSPEYTDIQQQVIFEDPTYEEKEKEVRRRV